MSQPGRCESLSSSFPGKGPAGVLAPHADLRLPGDSEFSIHVSRDGWLWVRHDPCGGVVYDQEDASGDELTLAALLRVRDAHKCP